MNFTELSLTVFFVFFALFLWVASLRNIAIFKVRKAFTTDDDLWPKAYEALPTYSKMLFAPRYYLLWSKVDWVRWQARQAESRV